MARSCIEHWIKRVCDVTITSSPYISVLLLLSNLGKQESTWRELYFTPCPLTFLPKFDSYNLCLFTNSQICLPYIDCKLASSGVYLCVWIQFNRSLNSALTSHWTTAAVRLLSRSEDKSILYIPIVKKSNPMWIWVFIPAEGNQHLFVFANVYIILPSSGQQSFKAAFRGEKKVLPSFRRG